MDQFQQQQQQQEQQRQQTAATQSYDNNTPNYICPHCGAAVDFHMELCPHCHHPLHPDVCTYCGAEMEPEDQFCCECGGPRKGITCPICGTLNFRSFCSHCNTPLDDLARAEVEKAQRDPVNPAKRNVLDLKNETCKNREKRNVLKISHTRHFKAIKKQSKTGCFYGF